jgi:periplasmic copper chaperone A
MALMKERRMGGFWGGYWPALRWLALGALLGSMPLRADILASAAWTRATVPNAKVGVGYFVLKNTGSQTRKLLAITSDRSDAVSLHQSSVDANGVAHMWPVASLELRPGEEARFEPNGRHVMFEQVKQPFKVGTTVPLRLQFDGGGKAVLIALEVRPLVPDAKPSVASADEAHHHH